MESSPYKGVTMPCKRRKSPKMIILGMFSCTAMPQTALIAIIPQICLITFHLKSAFRGRLNQYKYFVI